MENKSSLASALAKAQAEFIQPRKNKTVTVYPKTAKPYSFTYADYSEIVEAVRGPLSNQGVAFTHCLELREGKLLLVTRLIHGESGQILESIWPMTSSDDPKELGGDMTYGKRYSLSAITGCVADADADADPKNTTHFGDNENPPATVHTQAPIVTHKPTWNPPEQDVDLPLPKTTIKIKTGAEKKAEAEASALKAKAPPTEAKTKAFWATVKDSTWTEAQIKAYILKRFMAASSKNLTSGEVTLMIEMLRTKTHAEAISELATFERV